MRRASKGVLSFDHYDTEVHGDSAPLIERYNPHSAAHLPGNRPPGRFLVILSSSILHGLLAVVPLGVCATILSWSPPARFVLCSLSITGLTSYLKHNGDDLTLSIPPRFGAILDTPLRQLPNIVVSEYNCV